MRISNYPTDVLDGTELILGTNVDTTTQKYTTVNFTVDTLKTFIATDADDGLTSIVFEGTTSDVHDGTLTSVAADSSKTYTLPNATGYIALYTVDPVGVTITSTPAELNILDGATLDVNELNILDGVTSTTAELNILDGVTATTAEINLLDGSVAATTVASKALIYGASGQIVANAATFNDNIIVNTTGVTNNVKLTSTDSSASSAPDLVFYRNSEPEDQDTSGVIEFRGRNSIGTPNTSDITYGTIFSRLVDVSDQHSTISFGVNKGNGGGALINSVLISAIGANNSADGALLINPSTAFDIPTHNLDVNGTADISGLLTVGGTITGDLTGDVTGDLTGNQSGGSISATTGTFTGKISQTDSEVAHQMTSLGSTNTYFSTEINHQTFGGVLIRGISDSADGLGIRLYGTIGNENPTDTIAAVEIRGSKRASVSTNHAALADTETVFKLGNLGTDLITVLGSGDTTFIDDITISSTSPQIHLTNTGTAASNWVSFNTSAGRQGYVGQAVVGQQIALSADNAELLLSSYGAIALTLGASGAATFAGSITLDSVAITAVQTSAEAFADNDTSIMTSAAVDDRINSAVGTVDTLAEVLAIGNITDGTKIEVNNTSGGIDFIDNAKLRLGNDDDVEIYHNGSTYIDSGQLNTYIKGGNLYLDMNPTGGSSVVYLQDNGSTFGYIARDNASATTADLQFKVSTSDADMVFLGSDGGSLVTALTLDMSDGGNAIFNNDILAKTGTLSGTAPKFVIKMDTVDHGMTALGTTDTLFSIERKHSGFGGALIRAMSDDAAGVPLTVYGTIGHHDPTDTVAAIELRGSRKNGSGGNSHAALADGETVLKVGNLGDDLITVKGNGDTTIAGTVKSTQFKLSALNTAPSSATDTGTLGEIRVDNTYIYICISNNVWKRSLLSTW